MRCRPAQKSANPHQSSRTYRHGSAADNANSPTLLGVVLQNFCDPLGRRSSPRRRMRPQSRLADDHHRLPVTLPCPLQRRISMPDFLVAADQWGEMALPSAASDTACPNDPVRLTGSGTPLSSWLPRSSATNRPATWRCTRAVATTAPGSARDDRLAGPGLRSDREPSRRRASALKGDRNLSYAIETTFNLPVDLHGGEWTTTPTAHKLARHRCPVSLSTHQRVPRAAVRACERLGFGVSRGSISGIRTEDKCGPAFGKLVDYRFNRTDHGVETLGRAQRPSSRF